MLTLSAVLIIRSFWLQIVKGDDYIRISEANVLHSRVLRAARGAILASDGTVLATNLPSFDIAFTAKGVSRDELPGIAGALAELTKQDEGKVMQKLLEARRRPLTAVTIASNVPDAVVAYVAEHHGELRGVMIEPRSARTYPEGLASSHLLGYIGEISEGEIERNPYYEPGDWIGRAGIEGSHEPELFGKKGREQVWLDALGQRIRSESINSPLSGSRIRLTVDADLQRWAHEAFDGKSGAFVALEPATGKVLSLYSAPAYDPNVFVRPGFSSVRSALLYDTRIPLYNRALQASYSPGSTFKTVTMIAGLLSGRLEPHTRFTCGGSYAGMACWKKEGHGTLDLAGAYQNSCNVYFYQAGERIWIEPLYKTAVAMGLDAVPELGLGPEAKGVVPTPEWERANVAGPDGEHWGTGDVRNTAIGQGYVIASPIQMARLAGTAAVGKRMKLQLVESVTDPSGVTRAGGPPVVQSELGMSDEMLQFVRSAMSRVVEAGTGRAAWLEGLSIGGKTGTAQNPQGADHAWFIGMAPVDSPQVAFCVLVEHAGVGGGKAAAPIAKRILGKYGVKRGWLAAPAPPPAATKPR